MVLHPGQSVEAETLRQWLNSRVGKVQRLTWLNIVDGLPRSSIGKVLKRQLRDEFKPPA